VLGDGSAEVPDTTGGTAAVASAPTGTFVGTPAAPGALNFPQGTYHYKLVLVDNFGNESTEITTSVDVTNALGAPSINFAVGDLPGSADPAYVSRRLYRTAVNAGADGPYFEVANFIPGNSGGSHNDTIPNPPGGTAHTFDSLSGSYTYYVTFTAPGQPESRPERFGAPVSASDGRILLSNLPTPTGLYAVAGGMVGIYRNSSTNPNEFRLVDQVDTTVNNDYVDDVSDAELASQPELDFDGPKIASNTRLIDVTRWNGTTYTNPFVEGVLSFAATKGASTFPPETLQITDQTTVQELSDFMTSVFGIHTSADDPAMPSTVDTGGGPPVDPGGYVNGGPGTLSFVGNNGVANAISIDNQAFTMTSTTGAVTTPNLSFLSTQEAVGQSATTTFKVYDSLGIPIDLRVTTVLESTSDTATTYRWFAESPGNDTLTGIDVTVGTGLIQFDGNGNLISGANPTVLIDRSNIAALQPLEIAERRLSRWLCRWYAVELYRRRRWSDPRRIYQWRYATLGSDSPRAVCQSGRFGSARRKHVRIGHQLRLADRGQPGRAGHRRDHCRRNGVVEYRHRQEPDRSDPGLDDVPRQHARDHYVAAVV
jgi:flagellar hook protein FlgE